MGKIKLNLVSGAIVEKPLLNAFKANNNSYVVLDNEMNGSMGLPIILVCKFDGNKLTRIVDQNEWGIVKEYLKNIIAGNQIEFIKVNNELSADDIYYTQLTLPVPSFDALKNAYKVNDTGISGDSVMPVSEPAPVNVTPVVEPVSQPVMPPVNEPVVQNVEPPIVDSGVQPVQETGMGAPQITPIESHFVNNNPVIDIPIEPVMVNPTMDINTPPASPEVPPVAPFEVTQPVGANVEVPPSPVVEPIAEPVQEPVQQNNIPQVDNNVDDVFKEQKEAFMQACENMFDALVQKFTRELENRK